MDIATVLWVLTDILLKITGIVVIHLALFGLWVLAVGLFALIIGWPTYLMFRWAFGPSAEIDTDPPLRRRRIRILGAILTTINSVLIVLVFQSGGLVWFGVIGFISGLYLCWSAREPQMTRPDGGDSTLSSTA